MRKIGFICLALVMALGSLGVAYAAWAETLTIDGTVDTGEADWEFAGFLILDYHEPPIDVPDFHSRDGFAGPAPYFWPDPLGKNVGWGVGTLVDTDGDGDNDTLEFTLHNVYPSYFNMVAVYPKVNGTMPLKVQSATIASDHGSDEFTALPAYAALDLDGDGKDDIEIDWKNNFGLQMHPGVKVPEMSFWIHVLPDAPQGASLSFTISIDAVLWNKYVAPP